MPCAARGVVVVVLVGDMRSPRNSRGAAGWCGLVCCVQVRALPHNAPWIPYNSPWMPHNAPHNAAHQFETVLPL
eukprot:208336-Chlamydomonas_euryale.AAC.1